MEREERFFAALQKARGIRMEGDELVIDSEGTKKPLKFSRLKKPGNCWLSTNISASDLQQPPIVYHSIC
jgi:hypothetical protein